MNRSSRNSTFSQKQNKSKKEKLRKPLQSIQPSSANQNILVGKCGMIAVQNSNKTHKENSKVDSKQNNAVENNTRENNKLPDHNPEDNSSEKELIENEAYRQMTSSIVPESYWKEIAEQRRLALQEALIENEQLHEKIAILETKIEILQEMVMIHKDLAEKINSDENSDD